MITIIKPGLLTTIQDNGRYGFQKYGIISSGVMDSYSSRIANLLVGNDENQAVLEITLLGPTIYFEQDALISLCGADLSPTINNQPAPHGRPLYVKKGSRLCFGASKWGCRSYLAAAGGFAIDDMMGSKSTYLRAGIGGFHGRTLKSGDRLTFQPPGHMSLNISQKLKKSINGGPFHGTNWYSGIPYQKDSAIRVMEGRDFSLFCDKSIERFFTDKFIVTSKSDRMGYRLQGPSLLLKKPAEMISEAVNFGTIQVPPDGNPIILMADRQTIGGYPKIGQIATVDLPLIAQAKPGELLVFKKISLEESQLLYLKREQTIQLIKQGIIQQFC